MARTLEQDRARKAAKKAAANEIGKLPKVKNPKRRERCRDSLLDFLKTYCMGSGGFLKTEPAPRMVPIIEHLQDVVQHGGRQQIMMARAHGKSSFVKGACLYALVYGWRRFLVAVAARSADAAAMIADIWNLIETGENLAADFPEVCLPVRKLGGIMQRAANQTHGGERTRIVKTRERIELPTIRNAACSGAIMVARGFTSKARGLVKGSQRPDLLVLDDLQDEKLARNPRSVAAAIETLEGAFMGLGGHTKQIAAFMTATPIAPDDLAEQYATRKGWVCSRFPMVLTFPDCFGKKGGADLWQRYFEIRQTALQDGESEHAAGNAFYRANRPAMDAGGEVLNPEFYDHETELSGLQHAMNLWAGTNENNFAAEYQMQPPHEKQVFNISVPLILSRVRKGTEPFTVPPECVFVSCATDLNPAYGLTSAMIAFEPNATGFVPWYGIFTDSPLPLTDGMPVAEWEDKLYRALGIHAAQIAAAGVNLNAWGVDAGGAAFETVLRFAANCRERFGLDCMPMIGRAGRSWNPNVKSKIADARNNTVLCAKESNRAARWLAFNADVWRETAQRAWIAEPGAAGGLSLFDGHGARHHDFAGQICAEQLESKTQTQDGRTIYRWREIGKKHDYGDAVTMNFALAGDFGISSGGVYEPKHQRRKAVCF